VFPGRLIGPERKLISVHFSVDARAEQTMMPESENNEG
jgi:hypothetical protein